MQTTSTNWAGAITAFSRQIKGKVELYTGTTLSDTFLPDGKLQSITIDRTPTIGKFFGYSLCQKAVVKLTDKEKTVSVAAGQMIKCYIGVLVDGTPEYAANPNYYIDNIERDNKTNVITITAYDLLNSASRHTVNELDVVPPITLTGYADLIAAKLGTAVLWSTSSVPDVITYEADNLPNLNGTETLRKALDAIAEITGTICFIGADNKIHFKQLTTIETPIAISCDDYIELSSQDSVTISKITSVTELGNNISAGTDTGFNQIIRENPFIVNRADIVDILTNLCTRISGITIIPYNLKWRGNPAFEFGDCISIARKNSTSILTFYMGESLVYNGGLSVTSVWESTEEENIDSAPVSIGEVINQTNAKVDKVNHTIELIAGQTDANTDNIGALQISTNNIGLSVAEIQHKQNSTESAIATLQVQTDNVNIDIEDIKTNGVNKVVTKTGFTFDENGLDITKSGEEMHNTLDHTGMYVKRDEDVVLQANNEGVEAENVTVRTYLVVGDNSRFENYGTNRTGLFYIGGDS